jgi:transcriptional regulator with XRE-family HTH domain
MIIGERLQAIRKHRKLSQRELEERTGLLPCYISRVEHCHTVPSLETLQRFARGLETPLYALFHDGEIPPPQIVDSPNGNGNGAERVSGKHARFLHKLRTSLAGMDGNQREALLLFAQKLVTTKNSNGH